jgi:transcription elongation factor S-II
MADAIDSGVGADSMDLLEGGASLLPVEDVAAEVKRCKSVLDGKDNPAEELLAALLALRQMGPLPTKVLSETLIGKSVNTIAKAAADEAVRGKAKELVEEWRQEHRKRKAASEGGQPPLKRGGSSCFSLVSEAPSSKEPLSQESKVAGIQESLPPQLPRTSSVESQLPRGISRADSLLSEDTQPVPAAEDRPKDETLAPHRERVRQKLVEALGKAEEIEGEEEMRDPVKLADEIDQELHGTFPKKEEYMAQARSVLFNLKDKKNHTFKIKLMVGFYKPADVPKLTAEDMASDEKNQERAKQRKYAMEEIQTDWALKNGQQRFTGMFTCGKCKGTKTTYFQMQTRSSDEPMTTFVTCVTCNNRWKFC